MRNLTALDIFLISLFSFYFHLSSSFYSFLPSRSVTPGHLSFLLVFLQKGLFSFPFIILDFPLQLLRIVFFRSRCYFFRSEDFSFVSSIKVIPAIYQCWTLVAWGFYFLPISLSLPLFTSFVVCVSVCVGLNYFFLSSQPFALRSSKFRYLLVVFFYYGYGGLASVFNDK